MGRACDYGNARIAARRGRLLGRAGLREVAVKDGLDDQLDVLRRSLWGRALGVDRSESPHDLASLERALESELATQRSDVEAFLEPGARELVKSVLLVKAVGELAILLRGVARAEPADKVLSRALPSPELSPALARTVASAPTMDAAAAALERGGSPLGTILRGALPAALAEPGQLHLEIAMQRAALLRARVAALAAGLEAEPLRDALTLHIDHVNAKTLLSVESFGHAQDLHLEGGRLGRAGFARLAALPPAERVAPLAAFVSRAARAGGGARVLPGELATPGGVEQRLAAIRERALHAAARVMPLGPVVPLAWLTELASELRRLRLVLRGVAFGLPSDELIDLVEA